MIPTREAFGVRCSDMVSTEMTVIVGGLMGNDALGTVESVGIGDDRFVGLDVSGRRLVIFDFDGTLADTLVGITDTARRVLLEQGFAEDDLGDLSRLVGPPFPQAFSLVYGVSEAEATTITARYREIYGAGGPRLWPAFSGVPELLGHLRAAGCTVAVASSKRQQMIDRAIADEGIAGLIDIPRGKRDDRAESKDVIIRDLLVETGLAPDDAVMVGDRKYDVLAATANDVPCVGVLYGHTCDREELERAGASNLAETVADLERLLLG